MTKNNINIQHKIYCPVLAQLVERWTVTVFFMWLSTGRWFDSSKPD